MTLKKVSHLSTDTGVSLFNSQSNNTRQPASNDAPFTPRVSPATDTRQLFDSARIYDHSLSLRDRLTTFRAEHTAATQAIEKPPVNKQYSSPNYNSRSGKDIDVIVLHHTGSNNFRGGLSTLTTPNGQKSVSAHYLLAKDGTIYQLVDDKYRAYHAGESALHGVPTDVNARSIGIEIVSDGTPGSYTEAQYKALEKLVPYLMQEYKVPLDNLLGHKDVAIPKGRKDDPANFDFARIRNAVRGSEDQPASPRPTPSPAQPKPAPSPNAAPDVASPESRGITAPSVNLRRGARGSEVAKLQNALVELSTLR